MKKVLFYLMFMVLLIPLISYSQGAFPSVDDFKLDGGALVNRSGDSLIFIDATSGDTVMVLSTNMLEVWSDTLKALNNIIINGDSSTTSNLFFNSGLSNYIRWSVDSNTFVFSHQIDVNSIKTNDIYAGSDGSIDMLVSGTKQIIVNAGNTQFNKSYAYADSGFYKNTFTGDSALTTKHYADNYIHGDSSTYGAIASRADGSVIQWDSLGGGTGLWMTQAHHNPDSGIISYGMLYDSIAGPQDVTCTTTIWRGWNDSVVVNGITNMTYTNAPTDSIRGDGLIVDSAGTYLAGFTVSFQGTNGDLPEAVFLINGTASPLARLKRTITSASIGSAAMFAQLALSAGDTVSVGFTSNTDADVVGVEYAQFVLNLMTSTGATGGGSSAISVDGGSVTDPNFIGGNMVDYTVASSNVTTSVNTVELDAFIDTANVRYADSAGIALDISSDSITWVNTSVPNAALQASVSLLGQTVLTGDIGNGEVGNINMNPTEAFDFAAVYLIDTTVSDSALMSKGYIDGLVALDTTGFMQNTGDTVTGTYRINGDIYLTSDNNIVMNKDSASFASVNLIAWNTELVGQKYLTYAPVISSFLLNDSLSVNGNKIIDVADPEGSDDASTKNYVDTNSTFTKDSDTSSYFYATDTILRIRGSNESTFVTPGDNTTLVVGDEGMTVADSLTVNGRFILKTASDSVVFPQSNPIDNYIFKYDATGDTLEWVAESGGSGTVDSLFVNDTIALSTEGWKQSGDTLHQDTTEYLAIQDTSGLFGSGGLWSAGSNQAHYVLISDSIATDTILNIKKSFTGDTRIWTSNSGAYTERLWIGAVDSADAAVGIYMNESTSIMELFGWLEVEAIMTEGDTIEDFSGNGLINDNGTTTLRVDTSTIATKQFVRDSTAGVSNVWDESGDTALYSPFTDTIVTFYRDSTNDTSYMKVPTGVLSIQGASAGVVTIDSLSIAGVYNFPKVDGSNTQVLTTNGSGALAWTAQSGGAGTIDSLRIFDGTGNGDIWSNAVRIAFGYGLTDGGVFTDSSGTDTLTFILDTNEVANIIEDSLNEYPLTSTVLLLSGGTMTGSIIGIDSLDIDSGLYISDDITITGTVDGVDVSAFDADVAADSSSWNATADALGTSIDSTKVGANALAESDIDWQYEYIYLTDVHSFNNALTDSIYLTTGIQAVNGDTTFLLIDSAGNITADDKDTVNISGYVPYACTIDSLEVYYMTSAEITDNWLSGGSSGLTDSTAILTNTTDLTSTTWATAQYYANFSASAGERFSFKYVVNFGADNERLRIGWVRLRVLR